METARQFITFTAVSKAGRNGALGCWLPSIPRRIMAVVVTAALATCALCFAPTVFAQPASDTLGELLVGKAAFGDWRTDAPAIRHPIGVESSPCGPETGFRRAEGAAGFPGRTVRRQSP